MRWIGTAGIVIGLLVAARMAAAQPGVDLRLRPPGERAPAPERLAPPLDRRYSVGAPPIVPDRTFIGPTVTGEGTEVGFSAWIAPNESIGGWRPGGDSDIHGWAALGLTFTWGGPRHRPSGGRAVR